MTLSVTVGIIYIQHLHKLDDHAPKGEYQGRGRSPKRFSRSPFPPAILAWWLYMHSARGAALSGYLPEARLSAVVVDKLYPSSTDILLTSSSAVLKGL